MIVRIAEISVKSGKDKDLIQEYRVIRNAFVGSPGCLLIRLLRDQSDPLRFKMMMQWSSPEDQKRFQAGGGMASWIEHLPGIISENNVYRYFNEI